MADPKPVYKTHEELKKIAKEKFTDEEIENFINMGKDIACRPVLTELKNVIMTGPNSDKNKYLCKLVDKAFDSKKHAHVTIPIDVPGDQPLTLTLGISLSIIERGLIPQIDVPEVYINDVINQYNHMKSTACAYWKSFAEANVALVGKIAKYLPGVDFSELHIDNDNPMTLYFDENSQTRVCICPYYLDSKGRIMSKNPIQVIQEKK